MHDIRLTELNNWLTTALPQQAWTVKPLAADASFRRYFRIETLASTLVAMDAPPHLEDCRPFVAIAQAFAELDVQVPQILAANLEQGFLLISDLGDRLYSKALNHQNAEQLYTEALHTLHRIQRCRNVSDWQLPHFDANFIHKELSLFIEWFLEKHLRLTLSNQQKTLLNHSFELLIKSATEQPQICMHRDYHSRNLMWLDNNTVGVLDFQDAVWGPITYDAVSLLRDCYIAWPRAQVEKWALNFYEGLRENNLLKNNSREQFLQWFDWMGIQRHLKAIFIFARKFHRDDNANYLADIPRTLQYILDVTDNYSELKILRNFLVEHTPL